MRRGCVKNMQTDENISNKFKKHDLTFFLYKWKGHTVVVVSCENLTEKLAVGVVGLTLGGASQRATNYSICKNLLLECALGCPLHVQEGDRDVQSPTSRQLGSRERWWSQDSLPKGLKLTKVIIQHARKKLGT